MTCATIPAALEAIRAQLVPPAVLAMETHPGPGIDYIQIVLQSGPIVMGVLLLLLGASVVSWGIIVKKWLHLRRAQEESVKFLETFWQAKRLDAIYASAEHLARSPISQVFRAGYVE